MLIENGTESEKKNTSQINLFCMNLLNVSVQFTIICCWFYIIDDILILPLLPLSASKII